MNYSRLFTLAAITFLSSILIPAQQTELDRAVALYNSGDSKQAVPILEKLSKTGDFDKDADVHNFLGLGYFDQGKMNSSVKSFERAVKLSPDKGAYRSNLAFASLMAGKTKIARQSAEEAIRLDQKSAPALSVLGYIELWAGNTQAAFEYADRSVAANSAWMQGHLLKSEAQMRMLSARVQKGSTMLAEVNLLLQAKEDLEIALKLIGQAKSAEQVKSRLAEIAGFYDHYSQGKNRPLQPGSAPDPAVTPVRIISKPHAAYSESARSAGISGAVRLLVMLKADGTIGPILKLWGAGYGLDEQAIAAARRIKFEPKKRNGSPESSAVQIEYSFSAR